MEIRLVVVLVVAFGLGAAVIALASLSRAGRALAREFWSLYRTEILVVAAVVLPALIGRPLMLAALLVLLWRGQYELARLFAQPAFDAAGMAAMAMGAVMVAAGAYGGIAWLGIAGVAAAVAVPVAARLGADGAPAAGRVAVALGSLAYPGLLVALLAALRSTADGAAWVIAVYATVEIQDSFALLIGKLIGRHQAFPRLSPGKTWEGLLAGLACGGCCGLVLARYLLALPVADAALPVGLVLAGGLAGDLLASAIKRSRGEKDFAAIIPALGGALDIYDALLVAAPLVLLYRLAA
jgi:phosphatidate cytidylyltransferase